MLSSDFANFCGADWQHMDIMSLFRLPLNGHKSSRLVEPLGKAGASGFTFHVEAYKDNWRELVQQIKSKGTRPGVSLKPGTPIEDVYPLLEAEDPVEMVLVMTVEPVFGGQKFTLEMMDKVDVGLGPSTIDVAASAGANCIVAGSSVFGASDPAQVISLILRTSVADACPDD